MRGIRQLKKSALICMIALMTIVVIGWGTAICRSDKATIKVITDPEGAKVRVDTGEKGITPCTLEVPPGKRKLKIKKRAFIAAQKQVEISVAETIEINVKLTPIPTT